MAEELLTKEFTTELSEEEKETVNEYVSNIDINDSQMVLQYGAGVQKEIANFSEAALGSVKNKDLSEIGELLTGVVTELKDFDATEEKGFLGLFKKAGNRMTAIKAKYDKAEKNINNIVKVMEGHQVTLMKDIAMLDQMYETNLKYFKELSLYIVAGKEKLKEAREVELPKLLAKAEESGLPEDAQAAKDYASMVDRFEKKVFDLELTRNISMQMAPQIRLIQSNDTVMTEKIQSTLLNTIPLWKSQMIIAIGLDHSQDAARAQREVTDATNELLKKNAEALKMASIDTAKESERGIVDIETLTQTNQTLIETFDEVMKIQAEGRTKRAEAEVELQRIENEMKAKLIEVSSQSKAQPTE
ncbi:toxic anion resistance protein [Lacrimispora saccharolytica]|uniref:toxic anion resistance protein n=1 Tax=Lacrimispora saccharolytica TaxID=84030 RepID=UPI00265D3B9F|nr:toxic anion resistance protein [Lacrimispora saccharolytica]MCF2656434.1 toxic anion resistance protein [Lacrimispora saccharolytica]